MGTPSTSEWESIDSEYNDYRNKILEIAPQNRPQALWSSLPEILNEQEIDFAKVILIILIYHFLNVIFDYDSCFIEKLPNYGLKEFLRYDPKQRISARSALRHKYFKNLRKTALPGGQWDGSNVVFEVDID